MLEENQLLELHDAIKDSDLSSVHCFVHKDILTAELLQSYILLQMQFATRYACKSFCARKCCFREKEGRADVIRVLQFDSDHLVFLFFLYNQSSSFKIKLAR